MQLPQPGYRHTATSQPTRLRNFNQQPFLPAHAMMKSELDDSAV
jgi:hypothetical protein